LLDKKRWEILYNCFYIISNLSDNAIDETNETLEQIKEFYSEKLERERQKKTLIADELPSPQATIKAKLLPPTIRSPLTLDI